jgi:electron transfer flavoprotein beta subunit
MGLNIIVCIKSVIIDAPGGKDSRTAENCVLNPFDRPALDLALSLRKEHGGSVTALSMGPDASEPALFEAMAMGADRAFLLNDSALIGSDTLATSIALCAAVAKLKSFDLLFFGARTADSDTGQVGPQAAVGLDLPLITWVTRIKQSEGRFHVTRRADGFLEEYAVNLPVALTIHPEAVKVRDVGLAGIESAFQKKKVKHFNLQDIGLSPGDVGEIGSPTKVISLKRAIKKRECVFLTGTVEKQAADLMEELMKSGLIN